MDTHGAPVAAQDLDQPPAARASFGSHLTRGGRWQEFGRKFRVKLGKNAKENVKW